MKTLPVESLPGVCFEAPLVFIPTATSRVLAQAAAAELGNRKKVLDVGCGSGIVGLHLALTGESDIQLSMSDVSHEATSLASENAAALGVAATVKTGSVFAPWAGERFDLIVSDVSGVIPEIGDSLGWFEDVPNDSGSQGVGLAAKVIREAPSHTSRDGALIFPIISLSNEQLLLEEMSLTFTSVKELSTVALPLGIPLSHSLEMKERFPNIRIGSMGGIQVFYTTVMMCEGMKEEF